MRTKVFFPCVIVLFVVCGLVGNAHTGPFKGPWERDRTKETTSEQAPDRFNPLRSLVTAYGRYISPIDGKDCPMYPSCSAYSLLCFEKHGIVTGWVMTCDRLLHEADEMRKGPVVYSNGVERSYDPVENNDFWWHGPH